MDGTLTVVAGGAAGYLLYRALVADGEAPPPPPNRGGGNMVTDPAKSWKARNTVGMGVANMVPSSAQGAVYSPSPRTNGTPPVHGITGDQEQIDRAGREAIKQFQQKAADAYADLTEDIKIKGATAINHQIPAGLTGHESYEEAMQKIGAAVGALAGKAACSALPIPGVNIVVANTLCASIGAMVGAYLADKLGPEVKKWAEKQWTKVKAWAEEKWDDVEDAASDAYHWVGDHIF